jgi:glycosyltransferase involved in cell wall biosynthesis
MRMDVPARDISLVIPAYNEEGNIEELVRECVEVLARYPGSHELVLIEDGSTDGTRALIERLRGQTALLRPIYHEPGRNIGCHPSELEGLRAARGDVAAFFPADLQVRPSALPALLAPDADIVSGHRVHRADGRLREFISTVNNHVERLILGVEVHDAHSVMLFSRAALDSVVPQVRSASALIPAEILFRARTAGLRIAEVPVPHFPRVAGQQTGVTPSELIGVQLDLFRLRRTLRREARAEAAPAPRTGA